MSGFFITMEGTDGCGKTTQYELLKNYLIDKGYCVTCVRDPGGTPIGEKIRDIITDPENGKMCDITEALLYAAARAQLVSQVILPALKAGNIVLSDRFTDSNYVYQGYARGLGADMIRSINKYALNKLKPDVTIWLKLRPEDGMERKKNQAPLDRMEKQRMTFHRRVFDGYVNLAKRNGDRIFVVDANGGIDDIHSKIVGCIEGIFESRQV